MKSTRRPMLLYVQMGVFTVYKNRGGNKESDPPFERLCQWWKFMRL